MDIDSENKWAVYPIEKIEQAMSALTEAIVMARQAQAQANAQKAQLRAEQAQREINKKLDAQATAVFGDRELNKLICSGCRDGLPRAGQVEPYHMWADGGSTEPCTATPERKKALREYFYRDIQLGRSL
jgi:hypothetical protein